MRATVGTMSIVGALLFFACGGGAEDTRATVAESPALAAHVERPAIGGGPRDPERRFSSSIAKIAAARCDREMRCGNVGPNEKFATRAQCVSRISADRRGDINAEDCLLGVSQTGLLGCLQAIRDDDCGNPLDGIERIRACRSNNVCLK
jgi:hypothetical protein